MECGRLPQTYCHDGTDVMGYGRSWFKTTHRTGKRADIKVTDEDVIKKIEDRSTKVKTFAPLEPVNTPYKTLAEAWESFSANRDKLIEFVNTTNDDLRNHVAQLPVGVCDSNY